MLERERNIAIDTSLKEYSKIFIDFIDWKQKKIELKAEAPLKHVMVEKTSCLNKRNKQML